MTSTRPVVTITTAALVQTVLYSLGCGGTVARLTSTRPLVSVGLAALTSSAAVAVHESAHALIARREGVEVTAVRVRGVFSAQVERRRTTDDAAQIRICLAGPLATLALLLASVAAATTGTGAVRTAGWLGLLANGVGLVGSTVPASASDLQRALAAARSIRHLRSLANQRGEEVAPCACSRVSSSRAALARIGSHA